MNKAANPDIQTILCAMDAVDAARNTEQILDDEVNIDIKKAALRDKLKATYASQGIAVSDEIIERGIAEFFQQRFAFKKMPRTFNTLIAYVYVIRANIFQKLKVSALITLGVLVIGFLVFSLVDATKKRIANEKIKSEKLHADKLEKEKAEGLRKQAALKTELANLPARIKSLGIAISQLAKEDSIKSKSAFLVTEAGILASGGEAVISKLRGIEKELSALLNQISQEYTLVINGSGKTGFWRTLNNNPNEKRYYIVVNAVNKGESVSVQITNEENGQTFSRSQWAEQVSLKEFEAIRAEKASRGVLKDNVFAVKEKGYANPVYKQGLKVNDASKSEMYRITQW